MSFEQSSSEKKPEKERTAKELFWDETRRKLEEKVREKARRINEGIKERKEAGIILGDIEPVPEEIERGIKETVVAFNVMGLRTINACEGHTTERKISAPSIHVRAAGRPKERDEDSPEFKGWAKKNKVLEEKAEALLGEFYQDREVPANVRLQIQKHEGNEFTVHNGGADYRPVPEDLSDEERVYLGIRLEEYQREMQEFGQFLKEKYFKNP